MKGIQHIPLSNQLTSKLTSILNLEVTKVITIMATTILYRSTLWQIFVILTPELVGRWYFENPICLLEEV
jgi:hypothetical protein